jgi:muconolactone D-isomerase
MLYMVRIDVNFPTDMPAAQAQEVKAREKAYAQDLQRQGKWVHLWRIVGEYANISIFDATDHDELHQMLSGLPMFPYMKIHVTPLAKHPSAL